MTATAMTDVPFADFRPIVPGGAEAAFGPVDYRKYAPMYVAYHKNTVPEPFRRDNGTMWNVIVSSWFFSGLKSVVQSLTPRPGIDAEQALAHLSVVMKSWEPDHQSKEACAAYLMWLWFDDFEVADDIAPHVKSRLESARTRTPKRPASLDTRE